MKSILILCLSILFIPKASFASTELKAYLEFSDSFPFAMTNKTGTDFILLNHVAKKLDIKLTYTFVPWERCLISLKSGEADICFSASFKEERKEYGDFPISNGKVDSSRRMHTTSYSLFTKKENESKIKTKGLDLTGIDKTKDVIGVVRGYSIADDLTKAGYKVETVSEAILNFKKLASGRIKAIATLTADGDAYISRPEFKNQLVRLSPALIEKDYYLMLSKQFVEKNKNLADKIWNTIRDIRETDSYIKESQDFVTSK